MQFKVPPGSLSWLSALWVLLGAFVSFTSFRQGDVFFGGICLLFVLAGMLIWLDVRHIAWPLMIWFGIVIVGAVLLLAFKGWEIRRFATIAMAGYTIYELYQWRQSE